MGMSAPLKARKGAARSGGAQVQPQLLIDLWNEVQPMMGTVTLSALYGIAFRRAAERCPALANVPVTTQGVDFASLEKALATVDEDAARAAIQEAVKQLLTLFESLAGPIILKQVTPLVMRAEKLQPRPQAQSKPRPKKRA
jgi:hypothetical protein